MKPVTNSGMNYQHWFNWCPNESLIIIHTHVSFKQDNRDDHSPFNRCKVSRAIFKQWQYWLSCQLMGENFPGLALSQRISFPKLRFLIVGARLYNSSRQYLQVRIPFWLGIPSTGCIHLGIHINHHQLSIGCKINLKHCKWEILWGNFIQLQQFLKRKGFLLETKIQTKRRSSILI